MRSLVNVLSVSCFFLLVLPACGKMAWLEQGNHLFNKPESAIYFQYAGIVLNPIYPIFISAKNPLESQFKVVFKRRVLNPGQVNQFIVTDQDLSVMVGEINKALEQYKEAPESIDQHRVAVGVMVNGHLLRWTLPHDEIVPLLSLVQRDSFGKYNDLYKAVIYLKFRLGVVLTDKEKKVIGY
jgi:hypothetical protein